jgi:hypothetical protein
MTRAFRPSVLALKTCVEPTQRPQVEEAAWLPADLLSDERELLFLHMPVPSCNMFSILHPTFQAELGKKPG